MDYRHLPYQEYFINTSSDYNKNGGVTREIKYKSVKYSTGKLEKLFGLSHEANYEIHYEPERDVIQINFQWTVGFRDWFANIFEFSSKYYSAIKYQGRSLQLRVHHGWGNMYLAIKHQVRDKWRSAKFLHPEATTEIIGWSLGSAIAILCCQDLNYNFGVKPCLYTFGSVRPFKYTLPNKHRTHEYLDTLCTRCLNFADVNDLISYMPPFRGFTMINRVDLGDEKRSFRRMLHPLKYHTHYDRPELYSNVIEPEL